MAAIQQFLVCSNSSFANFFSWATAFSTSLTSFGWSQTADTGQVMWSGMSISAVSMSGTTATYTYSALTGLPLAVGRVLTVTGMVNAGNNKTFVITAFTGTTFTVTNATGVNETGASGVVTGISAVPGAYVMEIWTPNDGQTPFYVKIEYGLSTVPHIRGTCSTLTDGSGNAAGFVTTLAPWDGNILLATSPSATATYECNFSGGPGRFSAMMWRNSPTSNQFIMSAERSVNSSGTYTATHATYMQSFPYNGALAASYGRQQTLVFGIGAAPVCLAQNGVGNANFGFIVRNFLPNCGGSAGANTTAFNGSLCVDTVSPAVGFFDYPLTTIGNVYGADIAEGVPFQTTLYGATRTYIPSKQGLFANIVNSGQALCMRFD